jgi:23S rRNA (pseudouridine1915-N3)-methyltransferase
MIQILAIGKKHESWVSEGVERYQKRLRTPWNIEWQLLPHSVFEGVRAREEESERILTRLKPSNFVVLLDERGIINDSPSLSGLFEKELSHSRQVVLIIGGAYGVDERIHRRADAVWSLSELVFPHQLVRLIVTEQLYRAQEISRGGGYHHE